MSTSETRLCRGERVPPAVSVSRGEAGEIDEIDEMSTSETRLCRGERVPPAVSVSRGEAGEID
jgi:hypothetical protein